MSTAGHCDAMTPASVTNCRSKGTLRLPSLGITQSQLWGPPLVLRSTFSWTAMSYWEGDSDFDAAVAAEPAVPERGTAEARISRKDNVEPRHRPCTTWWLMALRIWKSTSF
eukprot:1244334-Amphidinium_carterae.2